MSAKSSAPRTRQDGGGFPGLDDRQAARRLAEYGPNQVAAPAGAPLYTRVLTQLRDPLVTVLLAAVALTVAIGDHADATVIAVVIVVNTTVGVVQEVRADHAIAALSALSAPTARVRRGGELREVAAASVVPGDVCVLAEGDVVPADGRLVEGAGLLVDESMVTGESVPVAKSTCAASPEEQRLLAGTTVVRGRGVTVVTGTGAASALGRVAGLLDTRPPPTPLQRHLTALGRTLALVTLVLCLLVFVLGVVGGTPPATMSVTAISLAVAAVPESLPAVVTLALALGARRMAARHALVRRLPAVETLGSVTVLATDKTGTITEGRMAVERVWTPDGSHQHVGTGPSRPPDQAFGSGTGSAAVRQLLTTTALCNDAVAPSPEPGTPAGRESGQDGTAALGDPTETALLAAAAAAGCPSRAELTSLYPRRAEEPFDSLRKRMTTVHSTPDGSLLVCLKGAPEVVLDPAVLDEPAPLVAHVREEAAAFAARGLRVLAAASGTVGEVPDPVAGAERRLRLLGLVALADPPKPAAAGTLAACRAAGITPVLITGDHPATAAAMAQRVGLVADGAADSVVTGADLAAGRVGDPTRVRVFARTDPEQKLDIVRSWQSRGQVTAMTGDGVNDGPALRQADIGVAMGGRGTEVARQAADLVLTDDELSTVVSAVEEGRRVFDNVRRFLLYGLAGGTAEILVMLVGPLLGLPLPLGAGQILWINLLTHGLTGVAMGAEPVSPNAMRRPPRPPDRHVLADGLWQRLLALAAVVTAGSLTAALLARESGAPWQSVLFASLLMAQLGVVLGLRDRLLSRANPFLPVAVAVSAGLGAAAVHLPLLRGLLGMTALGGREWAWALAVGAVAFAAARLARRHGGAGSGGTGPVGIPAGSRPTGGRRAVHSGPAPEGRGR
ncbi:cation-translocating P-type ATPase [Streptomyces solincola]|uniref:cation-translocating P-type ATPase n=1 Tax=Streptomyces solincola TaxID=2100817 RepID=UPI002158F21A|nr:cation-transporting P-type ATPase [Streptomyces solincola]